VPDDVHPALRAFYDLFDRRDLDRLLAYFHSDAVLRDHRYMSSWGGTREDWATMVEGWWSMMPDGRIVELEVLRAAPGRNLHVVTIAGTDSIAGGPAEFRYVLVTEFADGKVTACDFFDDEAQALEYFDRGG
jgi:ketosteroid isomerase-like protein